MVTAFDDDATNRSGWYNGYDLNVFRHETLELAYHCMLFNPHFNELVNKHSVNPLTGERRKNRLFTLPVLNALPEEFDFEAHVGRVAAIKKESIRKILVVDPNKQVCKLFCKAFSHLFPHTRVVGAQTAEEGLRLFTRESTRKGVFDDAPHPFDIVMVEERLFLQDNGRRRRRDDTSRSQHQTKSSSALGSLHLSSSPHTNKQASFPQLNLLGNRGNVPSRPPMSGSTLLRQIRAHEDRTGGNRALLIGISYHVDRDRANLERGGADLVWSKPPPTMSPSMGNQLLSQLLQKRKDPSLSLNIPEFAGDQ